MLRQLLHLPSTSDGDIDDPKNLAIRRQIIQKKPFLQRVYREWYTAVAGALPVQRGPVLELGCGAGFLKDFIPRLITTEVLFSPGIHAVLDGQALPFSRDVLGSIVMTDVFHHLPGPRRFFEEAARCVHRGGRIIMLEPWVTPWSRLVYARLHHEPFQPETEAWGFPPKGPW